MRRPVTRGIGIAALLAGMMGMNASSQGTSRFDMNRYTATRNETKKKKDLLGAAVRSWGYTRPRPPQNQKQFRKKWRNAPSYRPKANKR